MPTMNAIPSRTNMRRYASTTTVPVEHSRAEIEKLLQRHGATGFLYGWQDDKARIEFLMKTRHLRFVLALPDRLADEFSRTPGKRSLRRPEDRDHAWEQACRSSWRALLLIIKAKLEAIEVGVSVFEQEFLAFIVAPNGKTVGEIIIPQLMAGTSSHLLLPAGD